MNPYLILVVMLGFCGVSVGGFKLGMDHQKAAEADKKELIAEAVDAANATSAQAISKLKIKNTTITNEVQHEVRTNTIYGDCHNTPSSLQSINAALDPSSTYSPDEGKLPKVDAIK